MVGGKKETMNDAVAMVQRWHLEVIVKKKAINQWEKYAYGMPVVAAEAMICCSRRNRSNKSFHCFWEKQSTSMMGGAGSRWGNKVEEEQSQTGLYSSYHLKNKFYSTTAMGSPCSSATGAMMTMATLMVDCTTS